MVSPVQSLCSHHHMATYILVSNLKVEENPLVLEVVTVYWVQELKQELDVDDGDALVCVELELGLLHMVHEYEQVLGL